MVGLFELGSKVSIISGKRATCWENQVEASPRTSDPAFGAVKAGLPATLTVDPGRTYGRVLSAVVLMPVLLLGEVISMVSAGDAFGLFWPILP
ncbi:hypothetical protein [Xanthomonas maliensis]|uniref:hypothetical protein n=1 Tax=Xanthomonas maliensis TaxID=1321368 RepID=UPI0003B76AE7|nr:hypothetical protein [Xanthomonas maliensis]